jgi:hypothetical protein
MGAHRRTASKLQVLRCAQDDRIRAASPVAGLAPRETSFGGDDRNYVVVVAALPLKSR